MAAGDCGGVTCTCGTFHDQAFICRHIMAVFVYVIVTELSERWDGERAVVVKQFAARLRNTRWFLMRCTPLLS